jgi:hypothetical protein
MGGVMKKLLICFAAGCLGALVNSVAVWAGGEYGIAGHFNVAIAPALTSAWIYPRIVWGGIWGLLFVVPLLNSKPITKGVLLSIFPTLVQLLIVFPIQAKKGYFGLALGAYTPIFVVIYNIIWGLTTSLAIESSK